MTDPHRRRAPIIQSNKRLSTMAAALFLALAATGARAIDCGPYKVVSVQAESGGVLVYLTDQSTGFWKTLGGWSTPSTKPYLAVMQQAIAMDRPVLLRYADGYSCTATDYATQPSMIRM